MNTTTRAQRINKRQDAILEKPEAQFQSALDKMRKNIVPDLSMCTIAERFDNMAMRLKKTQDEVERIAQQRERLLAVCQEIVVERIDLITSERRIRLYGAIENAGVDVCLQDRFERNRESRGGRMSVLQFLLGERETPKVSEKEEL